MSRAAGPTPGSSTDDVPDADPSAVARAILLRQLTIGPRTREQLRQALRKRNVPPDVAEHALSRFAEVGLIDDQAYAEALIRSEASAGGLSRRRVQHKLREKGVPEDVASGAVLSIAPEAEEESALDLARRRAARMAGLDPIAKRRRLAGVLARRGYSSDTVSRVVGVVLDDVPEGE